MPSQPEGTLKKNIIAYLRGRGAFVMKVHGSEFQEAGLPDLMCCWQGMFVGLEIKTPGGDASPIQRATMAKIERAGGVCVVVHSIDEVQAVLKQTRRK